MTFWNLVFSAFFVSLAFGGLGVLSGIRGLPQSVPFFDLILMILATFRLTRLVVYDSIFQFFRNWFLGRKAEGFLGTLGTLVNCPWCVGLWFALFVVFFYYLTPGAWFFILFLAIAGVASVLQVGANLIGWNAEAKKREVLLAEHDQKNAAAYRVIDTGSKCG